MTRFKPCRFHSLSMGLPLVTGVVCWSNECRAQEQAAPIVAKVAPSSNGDTIRLTDVERNKILDSNTTESAAVVRGERGADAAGRGIHGEMGVMIGSNGTRGVYGVADIPLGDSASATIMFESSRFGGYRRRAVDAP